MVLYNSFLPTLALSVADQLLLLLSQTVLANTYTTHPACKLWSSRVCMAAPAVATTLQHHQSQQQQQQQIDAAFTYRGLQRGDFNVLKV